MNLIFLLLLARAEASWVSSWTMSPQPAAAHDPALRIADELLDFDQQTLRQILHLSVGGQKIRVRFSNEYGTAPLTLVNPRLEQSALTFARQTRVTLLPGKSALSDPLRLKTQDAQDLDLRFYLPRKTRCETTHRLILQKNEFAPGDQTLKSQMTDAHSGEPWCFVTAVEVERAKLTPLIVALGSSTTDGSGSTPGKNSRWPDFLAQRLRETGRAFAVTNAGVAGGRLLYDSPGAPGDSILHRFKRDVLDQPGVKFVIYQLGANDIGRPGLNAPSAEKETPEQFIAGVKDLVARARKHHLKMICTTIPPNKGNTYGYFTPSNERERTKVNELMRKGDVCDKLVDIDQGLRDPSDPEKMITQFDSGDHLHGNDFGYKHIAEMIDLSFFK